MALDFELKSTTRDARLDAIDDAVNTGGASAGKFLLATGTQPDLLATADSGTIIINDGALPNPAFAAASGGVMAKSGTWQWTAANPGTAGYFRIKNNAGTVIMQGTVGTSGCDLNLDNNVITAGQTITINTFSLTDGNTDVG